MTQTKAAEVWFEEQILPLEGALMRFLRRNWRNQAETPDLRQEIYVRVFNAALTNLPLNPKAFLFVTARNLLISKARRAEIVSIEHVADLESLNLAIDTITPHRVLAAREEVRRLQAGLDNLPARCREVILLRKVEGLSQDEAAERLGVTRHTIERQMVQGMRALVDFMLGGTGKIARSGRPSRARSPQ
jgi:RNA polymerase sigma factor (sigma-70 family)